MRIITGTLKGRRLLPPDDDAIRPTSERTREAIFNVLMHGQWGGTPIRDRHVLDLCCGTGALGLEALSRGAAQVTFVDQSRTAIALAKENAHRCGVLGQCQFLQTDATRLPPARMPAALVLMDPPYATPLWDATYASLCAGAWLEEGAVLVMEEAKSNQPAPTLPNTLLRDTRHYGKTTIHLLEYRPHP